MPIRHNQKGWWFGSQGPNPTKSKALSIARAAYAHGYKEESQMITIQQFVLGLFHGVTNAHLLHLQSRSYSEHMALGAFYESLEDLADQFVEAYQGKYGIIENYETEYNLPAPALEYMIGFAQYVSNARDNMPQDTELQNIIDEIAALIDSTIYKLRFLK